MKKKDNDNLEGRNNTICPNCKHRSTCEACKIVFNAITKCKRYRIHKVKMETVVNLMSGKKVKQAVGTPLCCDVSSETYWSM